MIIRYSVALLVLIAVFMSSLYSGNGGYWKQETPIAQISVTLSLLGVSLVGMAHLARMLDRYRNFRDLCRAIYMTERIIAGANELLVKTALNTRKASEAILTLQRYGINGIKGEVTGDSYGEVKEQLERNFRYRQERFYALYDQCHYLEQYGLLNIVLKDRDWKAYSGKPELPPKH